MFVGSHVRASTLHIHLCVVVCLQGNIGTQTPMFDYVMTPQLSVFSAGYEYDVRAQSGFSAVSSQGQAYVYTRTGAALNLTADVTPQTAVSRYLV